MSTLHDVETQGWANRAGARRLHFTGAMADPDTSPMPRDELIGLLTDASDVDHDRITAEIPLVCLDELLAPEASPQGTAPALVLPTDAEVRSYPWLSHHIVLASFTVTVALGLLLFLL
ncbi:MAG TPA: hypothetical protein VLB44_27625 [Kofleriaceae bacterium]|nr:hypothetical protein [Kofleriaceae bacterium]